MALVIMYKDDGFGNFWNHCSREWAKWSRTLSKAKFRVKRVSEISEAIGPESQTAHDLPDNLQNLR